MYIYTYTHYIHNIHAYMHAYIHACMHACMPYITLRYVTLRYITLHYVMLRYVTLHTSITIILINMGLKHS